MEEQNILKTGIGTKESEKLKPAKVKIESVEVRDVGKGKKVICSCKHPDKAETIDISAVQYVRDKKIATTGLWFNEDADKMIQKNSALAVFLNSVGTKTANELVGKEVETVLDDKNFLCFKAY